VELVTQQHRFRNLSNTNEFYYQQRFNSQDADNSLTVSEILSNQPDAKAWIELLHVTPLLQKPLIQLSNGENKRVQIANALSHNPSVIVFDNPFIGLDAEGRKTLHTIIDSIASNGVHIILISTPAELPACITHVALLDKGRIIYTGTRNDFEKTKEFIVDHGNSFHFDELKQLNSSFSIQFQEAVKMVNVNITYEGKKILDNINWTVKKGECWSLSGPNGAGKSTLLSLITADNPQAYANEIYLFDKKRGSGESIWDIKRNIGYVSPELHLYFDTTATCFEVIASGLFDTIGLFRILSSEQEEKVLFWMELLELENFRHRAIRSLSTGQQRLIMLARALVKNPPLLILDEPCQGLDDEQSQQFKQLVNEVCKIFGSTLIYVSHYQKDIPECVEFFLKLNSGRMV
jgi:molybdate transport system ATP-binding protein